MIPSNFRFRNNCRTSFGAASSKALHGSRFVFVGPQIGQIDSTGFRDIFRFVVHRKQGGAPEHSDIDRQGLMAAFENLVTQKGVIFAFGIKGSNDADSLWHSVEGLRFRWNIY